MWLAEASENTECNKTAIDVSVSSWRSHTGYIAMKVCFRAEHWDSEVRGQSAGRQHHRMLLMSFHSQTQQVALCSVACHLVHIVNPLWGAVQSTARTPDLHGPVTVTQRHKVMSKKRKGHHKAGALRSRSGGASRNHCLTFCNIVSFFLHFCSFLR